MNKIVREPLQIAIDGRVLVMSPTGIGRYTRSILGTLAAQHGENFQAVFFTHAPVTDHGFWPLEFKQKVIPFPTPMIFRPIWDHILLPGAVRRQGPFDLFFSPLSVVPRNLGIPTVATVHDLAFFFLPEIQPFKYRFYWCRAIRTVARHASRIIAVSESTRADLEQLFPGVGKKTAVIHEAPASQFSEDTGSGKDFDIAPLGRYFLAVGTLEPRKNYPFLLRVFSELVRFPGCENLKLVIAGGPGWGSREIERLMAEAGPWLVRLNYVPYNQLPDLYRGAVALVFPSLYEGFGLPAIEALACGTPVIASDSSSLPEVIGDAGVLLPLNNLDDWVRMMSKMALEDPFRKLFTLRGPEQARKFSWERAACQTWEVFQEVAGYRRS